MVKPVNGNDKLSRMVCIGNKKNYCRPSNNEVKAKAFKPNSNNQTSVFVTTGLGNDEIWELGETHLCGEALVYGRAEVDADAVLSLEKIGIDYNDNPKYHANLNWPAGAEKDDIQDMANVLAAKAECITK